MESPIIAPKGITMIIQDLGMLYPETSKDKKRKRRFCLVSCAIEGCVEVYKAETSTYINKGAGKYCPICRNVQRGKGSKTHGDSGSTIHTCWRNIKNRCYNKNHPSYSSYGGRGIYLYEEWLANYDSFKKHIEELENFDVAGYSIDRIDNDKGYVPGNVRYANKTVQSCNQRKDPAIGVPYHNQHNKYRCYVTENGKQKQIGMFTCQLTAAKYRNEYILKNKLQSSNILCDLKGVQNGS